jgi:methyltransferase-like protein 6
VVVEVGCGVGNFALPLLSEQQTLNHLYACDFSEKAIDLLRTDDRYNSKRCTAFVADLTVPGALSQEVPLGCADIVTSIFVLSALPPEKFALAVANVKSVLKEGGLWLIRDYAVNDAAQLRFKDDRKISDSLYVRQDGTLSYFFDKGTTLYYSRPTSYGRRTSELGILTWLRSDLMRLYPNQDNKFEEGA